MIRTLTALTAAATLALCLPASAGTTAAAAIQAVNQPAGQPRQVTPLTPPVPEGRDAALWNLMSDYLELLHAAQPESIGPMFGDERLNDRMGDVSAAAQETWAVQVQTFRAALEDLDDAGFSPADRLDAGLLAHDLDQQIATFPLKRWQTPVAGQSGPQVWLPQLADRVPMRTEKHRADYLVRLKRMPIIIGDTIDNMRLGMAEGRVPPKATVAPAIPQALAQGHPRYIADPTTSPFYRPFLTLDQDSALAREARRVIAERIVPVYHELALFLQNEYLPACRDTVGITQGVDGRLAYDIALAEHTTLPDATADSIHQTGLREVARIRQQMMEAIERTDWATTGPGATTRFRTADDRFAAFVDHLRTDPRFYFTDPEDLLNAYKVVCKDIDAAMPELFGKLPRLSYGVRPIPTFASSAAPTAYYYPGSSEAAIPGYFMANTSQLDQRPKYEMVALTLHEAVPGHHHQIALAQELENQHPLRSTMGFTAFVEGWALYAERLGLEVGGGERGLYADPYDDFGRLNYEMWRAMRLVVDTGIHALGWDRQRAIDYMTANSALSAHNIASEVDRYIAWPGQATGYMIGQIKIRELRAEAESALGDRFDRRTFHDAILESGAVPLPVLEDKIRRWIEAQ